MASRSAVRPLGAVEHQAALQVFHALVKELVNSARSLKLTRKELILGIGGLEELNGRFARLADFVGHAAAEIKDHADGDGHIFGGEGTTSCSMLSSNTRKLSVSRPVTQAVVGVGDGDVDEREVDIEMDRSAGLERSARAIFRTSSFLTSLASSRLPSSLDLFSLEVVWAAAGSAACNRNRQTTSRRWDENDRTPKTQ